MYKKTKIISDNVSIDIRQVPEHELNYLCSSLLEAVQRLWAVAKRTKGCKKMNNQQKTWYICDPRKAYNCKKNTCIYNASSPWANCLFTSNINYAARDTITGIPKKGRGWQRRQKNERATYDIIYMRSPQSV